ncbi:hypothetical protein Bca101_009597 [Brassica carinata]
MDVPDNNSETDSSEDMDVFKPNANGEIRLEELPDGLSSLGGVTYMLTVTAGCIGGLVGAADKGKRIMIDADVGGGQFFGSHMGSGSGYANADGANVQQEHNDADDCEEQG